MTEPEITTENDKPHIIMDSQVLNSLQSCALRTDLYFNHNLRPSQVPVALESGDLLHKMMEIYYTAVMQFGNEIVYSDENWKKLVDKCMEAGAEYASIKLSNLQPSVVDETIYQFSESVKYNRMDGWKIKEVESPFIVPVHEDDSIAIYYTGKIDLIAEDSQFGDIIVDHKSMRRDYGIDPLNNQFTGYSFATGIRTMVINRVGFQKTLKPDQRFKRPAILYTQSQVDRWKANVIWWARAYLLHMETGIWPENRTSCDKYGGCLFRDVCLSGTDEARDFALQAKYIVGEPWDPTQVLGGCDD